MKFKVVYTKIIKETIEAESLDEACTLAQKKAKAQKLTVQSVTPDE
jgi:hypothetical protein